MLIEILKEVLIGERQLNQTSTNVLPHNDTDAISVIIVPDEFKSDIENLKAHIGVRHWKSGL